MHSLYAGRFTSCNVLQSTRQKHLFLQGELQMCICVMEADTYCHSKAHVVVPGAEDNTQAQVLCSQHYQKAEYNPHNVI